MWEDTLDDLMKIVIEESVNRQWPERERERGRERERQRERA